MAAQMTEQLPLRQQGLGLLGMPAQRVQQMTTGTSNEAALLQTISSLQSGILRLETQLYQERLREQHLAAMATKFSQQLSSVEAQQTQEHQHLLSSNAEVAHLYERLNKTMVEESKLASLEEEAEKAAKSAVAQAQTERSRAEAERVRAMQHPLTHSLPSLLPRHSVDFQMQLQEECRRSHIQAPTIPTCTEVVHVQCTGTFALSCFHSGSRRLVALQIQFIE